MLLPLMLLLTQDRLEAMIESYRVQTRAEIPCNATDKGDEIVVCARRDADRYRVPFVPAGRPENSVPLRTSTLLEDHGRPCGEGAFLVHCGKVGVTATYGGGRVTWVERERAP